MIQNISIIGSGNVATHLAFAFKNSGITIDRIVSKSSANAQQLALDVHSKASQIEDLPQNDLVIVCVPDDLISEVLKQIDNSLPVVYTSGSVGINELPDREKLGVFYPLQTFSKASAVKMQEVPILLEAENNDFLARIHKLASSISDNTQVVNSEQRRKIHMAAVWINNFTNHVVYQAQKITQEQDLDYQLLLPLLKETLSKLNMQSAFDAQTGPARRGDVKTINKHLNAQVGTSKELYELLSKSIKETYNNDQL